VPQVPKPKRKSKQRVKKERAKLPWLQRPTQPDAEDVRGSINLFAESNGDDGESSDYRAQKAMAVAFTKMGLKDLPPWVWGVCLNCGTYLKRGRAPQAHHWCVRRSAGVSINNWWNLWPLCSESCHHEIENERVGSSVANEHYLRIARYHLQLNSELPVTKLQHRGRAWILSNILGLVMNGGLDEYQPYYLPPVEETENDS
jgi:hypothetical protein